MVGWSDYRATARRMVHATFGEPFAYVDTTLAAPVNLLARHRTRQIVHGATDSEYADVLEGINRVVFSAEDLAAKGVILRRGGRITIPPFILELDQPEPVTGPIEIPWSVVDVSA